MIKNLTFDIRAFRYLFPLITDLSHILRLRPDSLPSITSKRHTQRDSLSGSNTGTINQIYHDGNSLGSITGLVSHDASLDGPDAGVELGVVGHACRHVVDVAKSRCTKVSRLDDQDLDTWRK